MNKNILVLLMIVFTGTVQSTIYVDHEKDPMPAVDVSVILPVLGLSKVPLEQTYNSLLSYMLQDGIAGKGRKHFNESLADFGSKFSFSTGVRGSTWSISFPYIKDMDYSKLSSILAQAWETPNFSQERFDLAKKKIKAGYVSTLQKDSSLVYTVFSKWFLKKQFSFIPSYEEDLKQVTLEGLKSYFNKKYSQVPDLWVGVVGPSDAKNVVEKIISSVFKKQGSVKFTQHNKPLITIDSAFEEKASAETFLIIDKPNRSQTYTLALTVNKKLAFFGNELLSQFSEYLTFDGGFKSIYMNEIREKNGLAYSVHSIGNTFYGRPMFSLMMNPLLKDGKTDKALAILKQLKSEQSLVGEKSLFKRVSEDDWKKFWTGYVNSKLLKKGTPGARLAQRKSVITGTNQYSFLKQDPKAWKMVRSSIEQFNQKLLKKEDTRSLIITLGDFSYLSKLAAKYYPSYKIVKIPYNKALSSSSY